MGRMWMGLVGGAIREREGWAEFEFEGRGRGV